MTVPDPDLEIRGGGGTAPAPWVPPLDPPLYHDTRFTVVGIDPGLVVHGVGQVSMQIRGTSKARKA